MAARTLANEAGDPDPGRLARAGLLHGLGRWAVAAIEPAWIARWHEESDLRLREQMEQAHLGTDLCDLGRRLAERWGCEPLIVEAAWLHGLPGAVSARVATEPGRLAIIQEAYRWAEKTLWALKPAADQDAMPTEPRLRILVAEVQSRCGSHFSAADATPHEEAMTRQSARLMLRLAECLRTSATTDRMLRSFADANAAESPESWADRAGLLWCEEPEVTAARVLWKEGLAEDDHSQAAADAGDSPSPESVENKRGVGNRPPAVVPLCAGSRTVAEIHLWCDGIGGRIPQRLQDSPVLDAWSAWASLVADRSSSERRLYRLFAALRQESDEEQVRLRDDKLNALAEFAAGAGHELNNPLAVIVGRAQLLLGRSTDSETCRSLRIILSQAQRTHRILRDLMFVARPPVLRPRACRPSEILRMALAGFQTECESRGIRLVSELEPGESQTWADPDALGHLAETLIRNAMQATSPGGRIQVRSGRQGNELRWSVADSGSGMSPSEAGHLFDPFFCGRQAGRGLGLGLPRAARSVFLAGGRLNWTSSPGQGTVFQVHLPLTNPPDHLAPSLTAERSAPIGLNGQPPS
jgi:signal transduction histidine kinase